jgi:hypothetical protein
MIIIPIHIFLDDKPTSIPKFFNNKFLGIRRRNIRNAINGKNALSKDSKKNAYKKISSFSNETPGVKFIISEEDFSESLMSFDKSKPSSFIQDEYTRYYLQIIDEIFELDSHLGKEAEKIKLQPQKTQIDKFRELLLKSKFPWTMLNDNLFDGTDDELKNIQITIFKITVDILFYILAAYDVEYSHYFLKNIYGEQSIFLKYLPFFNEDTIQNPSKLWFDKLKTIGGFKTIHDFATAILQLRDEPENHDIESQMRMIRKWRVGQDKQLPSWENVNRILEVVIKSNNINDKNEIELYKEQGRFVYAHVKIFQILLNNLMVDNSLEKFGMDHTNVVDFFERYLYWHNYHSVIYAGQSTNTCP